MGGEILGVCMDEEIAAGRRALEEWGAPFRSAFDGGGWSGPAARAYGVRSIPRSVLVGPDGRILRREVIPESLLEK